MTFQIKRYMDALWAMLTSVRLFRPGGSSGLVATQSSIITSVNNKIKIPLIKNYNNCPSASAVVTLLRCCGTVRI